MHFTMQSASYDPKEFLRFSRMNKLIGMAFQFITSVIFLLACPAESASSIFPCMFNPLKADIALRIIEGLAD